MESVRGDTFDFTSRDAAALVKSDSFGRSISKDKTFSTSKNVIFRFLLQPVEIIRSSSYLLAATPSSHNSAAGAAQKLSLSPRLASSVTFERTELRQKKRSVTVAEAHSQQDNRQQQQQQQQEAYGIKEYESIPCDLVLSAGDPFASIALSVSTLSVSTTKHISITIALSSRPDLSVLLPTSRPDLSVLLPTSHVDVFFSFEYSSNLDF